MSQNKTIRTSALALTLAAMTLPAQLGAADPTFYFGGFSFNPQVESMKERRFIEVVRQHYDFSCGSAAVATLLQHHYAWPTDEESILQAMMKLGDREKIRREGFSLLDMKRYLSSIGFTADGYRAPLAKLKSVGIPAIALINHNGYLHFVVIKGIREDVVLVGDPALGMRVINRKSFEQMWNGIIFVISNDKALARTTFDRDDQWSFTPSARLDAALSDRSLATFTVQTTPTPNYYF